MFLTCFDLVRLSFSCFRVFNSVSGFALFRQTEAESASAVARVSPGEDRRPETNFRGPAVVDHRTVDRDGGDVRKFRRGVSDRGVF